MIVRQTQYYSYLLRIWQSSDAEPHVWRASLESAFTGQQYNFATLRELYEFLDQLALISSSSEKMQRLEIRAASESELVQMPDSR